MKYFSLFIIAFCFFSSCTTLNKTAIQRLEPISFEPVALQPTYDLYDFRVDIIRQKDSDAVDSTSFSTDTPYHPLGFALGNGLFFDLNENLSFDILALMGIERGTDISVLQSFKKSGLTWRKIDFAQNAWCSESQRLFKQHRCYDLEREGDEIKIFRKDKLRFSILNEPDSILLFNRRGKVRDQVVKIAEHTYLEGKRRRKDQFELKDTQVDLDNYLVTINETGDEIRIMRQRKRKNKLLYRMVRNENTIYVYNNSYRGYKIILNEGEMTVYNNQKKLYSVAVQAEASLTQK